MAPVIGLQRGQALDAGRDVAHERRHCHVVQTFQLPDEDPGDAVESSKEQDQRTHSHEEPWENTADDTKAEENQYHVLDEHLSLEWQTGVDWWEN